MDRIIGLDDNSVRKSDFAVGKVGFEEMDLISGLPDALLSKILSYLPTKTSVSTSILSRRWIAVFQQVPFIDLVWNEGNLEDFFMLVDIMLTGHNENLHSFSVLCDGPVSCARVNHWVTAASKRPGGLANFSLRIASNPTAPPLSLTIACSSLKSLTFRCVGPFRKPNEPYRNPNASVSFVTPELKYLDYKDSIPSKYGELSFGSLIEAKLDLIKPDGNTGGYYEYRDDVDASAFFKAISGVKVLHMSSTTLTAFSFCRQQPTFQNLIHLSVGCDIDLFWPSLPLFIQCCPFLETLVSKGDFHHCDADTSHPNGLCCLYMKPFIASLKEFGLKNLEIVVDYDVGKALRVVKHFVSHLPHLEKLTVYADADDLMDHISAFPKASPACHIIVLPRFS